MGKKSRSPTASSNRNGAAASPDPRPQRSAAAASEAPVVAATQPEPGLGAGGGEGWVRMKRSLVVMLLLGGLAMSDPLTLKEGFTVVVPDSTPLLAVVALFAWLVWRRWAATGKQGLHPLFRALGFMIILAAGTSLLPFNSTVTMYEIQLLSAEECYTLAEAAAATVAAAGFVPTHSRFDPTAEVPLEDLAPEVSALVSKALEERLLPFVGREYGDQGTVLLEKGSFYLEHYQAYHEPAPQAHLRPGQLTVRVELDPPDSTYVGGGGVILGSMTRTITPAMGNALIVPAKLKHGSSELGSGTRSVLVGTMTVRGQDPWQRFVGIWRLWGLFTRKVRYIADKRLKYSGVDTIPVLEPEVEDKAKGEGAAEEASSSVGDSELEF